MKIIRSKPFRLIVILICIAIIIYESIGIYREKQVLSTRSWLRNPYPWQIRPKCPMAPHIRLFRLIMPS